MPCEKSVGSPFVPPERAHPAGGLGRCPADHTGLYRNPLPLSDGQLVAVHTGTKTADRNSGSTASPASFYDFRLKVVIKSGAYYSAAQPLTPGITATISYYNPDTLVSYSGVLWELDPVEVRPRTRPARLTSIIPSPEEQIFTAEQQREYTRSLDESLDRVKRLLGSVAGKSLSPELAQIVGRIQTFQKQAEQAREQDLVTAVSLARRADLLAKDLLERLP